MVHHLPSTHETLGSSPSITENNVRIKSWSVRQKYCVGLRRPVLEMKEWLLKQE